MMIPKVIHYCWFGRGAKPELIQKCIASWHEFCPDYEIIEWNEDNLDVNSIPYTAAAYADKKWAFVSDYARLKIIHDHGGIYLDTDVLLHDSLDDLLQYGCWLASDDVRYMATGLGFGAEKGHRIIKKLMEAYATYKYPSKTNVMRDSAVLEQALPNWVKSDENQQIDDIMLLGCKGYGTYAKHLYTYSWAEPEKYRQRMEEIKNETNQKWTHKGLWKFKCFVRNPRLIQYFAQHRGTLAERIYTFCAYDLLDNGPVYFVKRLFSKFFK